MFTRLFFQKRGGGNPEGRGRFTLLARLVRTRPVTFDPLSGADRPAESFEATWRTSVKKRTLLLIFVLVAWAVGIQARLVNLQVFQHEELSRLARDRQQFTATTEARRGDIVDRNGEMLAYTVDADAIVADPSKVVDDAATAMAICAALGDCSRKEQADLAARLDGRGKFTIVRQARSVTPAQSARVGALKLPGIALQGNTRRYYPRVDLAAHVLGFVGRDNDGQAGIEYAQDKVVRGQDGRAFVKVDAHRTRLETRVDRAPVPGATLELTIDLHLQYLVERELAAGVAANRAKAGTAIVMNPFTGEILALASYPTFNPNIAGTASDDDRRNRAVQDVYEPGSTFKIVTAAAALEDGLFSASDLIDCSPGYITFPGRKPITEAAGHNYGVLSLEDAIVKSSNVCAIKIGLRVGVERLSRYVHRFGFGQILSPDLLGQSRGIWNPAGLDQSGLASVSMGYQVGVTPLQMASAASVIANGGLLMEPHLVRAVTRDGVRRSHRAESRPAHDLGRHRGDTHDHHGRRDRTRHGEIRAARSVSGGGQDRHGEQGDPRRVLEDRLQRVVRRVRPVAQAGVHDPRRDRHTSRHRPLRRHRRGTDRQAHRRGGAAARRRAADDRSGAARHDRHRRGAAADAAGAGARGDPDADLRGRTRADARRPRSQRARGHADPWRGRPVGPHERVRIRRRPVARTGAADRSQRPQPAGTAPNRGRAASPRR